MGNVSMTIHAVGSHHNHDNPHDLNKMFARFVDELKAAGHYVHHAHLHHGAAEDMLSETAPTRAGAFGMLSLAATAAAAAFLLWPSFPGFTGPAYAADLPAAAKLPAAATSARAADWNGLYVEGYGLYGANITDTTLNIGTTVADLASAPHGPGIGGALGYNVQVAPNSWVLGVRADIAYANLTGSGQVNSASLLVSNATNYLGDVDLVVGLPLNADGKLLGYVNGGFAFGGAKPNLQVASLSQAASDTSTGWNVGAGFAYQLDPRWRLFMEGDYYQLGDRSLMASDPLTGAAIARSTAKYHIVVQKLGVGFSF